MESFAFQHNTEVRIIDKQIIMVSNLKVLMQNDDENANFSPYYFLSIMLAII